MGEGNARGKKQSRDDEDLAIVISGIRAQKLEITEGKMQDIGGDREENREKTRYHFEEQFNPNFVLLPNVCNRMSENGLRRER